MILGSEEMDGLLFEDPLWRRQPILNPFSTRFIDNAVSTIKQ